MPRQEIEIFSSSDKRLIAIHLTNALAWLIVFGIFTHKAADQSMPQHCEPTTDCATDASCIDRKNSFHTDFKWSLAGGIIFEYSLAMIGVALRVKQHYLNGKTDKTIATDFMQAPKLHAFLLIWAASFTALMGVGFKRLYDLATTENMFCYPVCAICYDEMDWEAEGAVEHALLPLIFGMIFTAVSLIVFNLKIILNALGIGYTPALLQEFVGCIRVLFSYCLPDKCCSQRAEYTPIADSNNADDVDSAETEHHHCCCYIPNQQIM